MLPNLVAMDLLLNAVLILSLYGIPRAIMTSLRYFLVLLCLLLVYYIEFLGEAASVSTLSAGACISVL